MAPGTRAYRPLPNALAKVDALPRTKQMERMRLVIADDSPEMLDTVEQRLAPYYEIVGKAPDGLALIECARRLKPDLLVIDVSMPKLSGIDALRQLRSLGVQIPAVILTNHDDEDLAQEALAVGSQGFVLKSRMGTDLRIAVGEALAGRIFISKTLRKKSPIPTSGWDE